jgi:hypothetical protein
MPRAVNLIAMCWIGPWAIRIARHAIHAPEKDLAHRFVFESRFVAHENVGAFNVDGS